VLRSPFCWVSLRSRSSSVQLPERTLIKTDGKLCFHPKSGCSDSDFDIYTHPMRTANKNLRTACRTKPDTIRNWSILLFWRKQAFLTSLNQNSVSRRPHLISTCTHLGGSTHVVLILPAAWESPGSCRRPGTTWGWRSWGTFSGEQTHCR